MCRPSSLASSQLVTAALPVTATQPADEKNAKAPAPSIVRSMTITTASTRRKNVFRSSGFGESAGLSWIGVLYAHEAVFFPST